MNNKPTLAGHRHFHFKQFSLTDEGCAMKIGTDGVLLGSVAATYHSARVLDIGTGCGLLALMIAQESSGSITALEPEDAAAAVAIGNVEKSPWPERIQVIKDRFQHFVSRANGKFDLLVCNPPYFRNSLRSPNPSRNLARHDDSLPTSDLFQGVARIITPDGTFLVIFPADQDAEMENQALIHGLNCRRKIIIFPNPGKKPKRIIMAFSLARGPLVSEKMWIEDGGRHAFSEAYKKLTGKFYLKF